MNARFQESMVFPQNVGFAHTELSLLDRLGRWSGKKPGMVAVVDQDPLKPSSLSTPESYGFFTAWAGRSIWRDDVTVKMWEYSFCPKAAP